MQLVLMWTPGSIILPGVHKNTNHRWYFTFLMALKFLIFYPKTRFGRRKCPFLKMFLGILGWFLLIHCLGNKSILFQCGRFLFRNSTPITSGFESGNAGWRRNIFLWYSDILSGWFVFFSGLQVFQGSIKSILLRNHVMKI